jgi:4-diphosphocytidyl-2-C-methyl-D-erythritol kinase
MEGVIRSSSRRMPAKINLWLEIIGKRSDGYHDLSSLMLPIGIYDDLWVQVTEDSGIRVECDHPDVPLDERNLAWRAARIFLDHVGVQVGAAIKIRKSIPVGAGLGGGSADAAGVLLALDECLQVRVSEREMHDLARRLGADVPFFLYRRPALAKGIGDVLEWVEGIPAYSLVCIKPPIMVSTAWVYGSLKLTKTRVSTNIDGLKGQPWRMSGLLVNDLECVTLDAYPRLRDIKDWLVGRHALGALMSGSGPTVFGVFRDGGQAREVEGLAKAVWTDCWVAATEVLKAPDEKA